MSTNNNKTTTKNDEKEEEEEKEDYFDDEFVSQNSKDRRPKIVKVAFGIILLWVVWALQCVCFIIMVFNQMNVIYEHTYDKPSASPGMLISNRYGLVWWTEFLAIFSTLIMLPFTLTRLILYNNTWVGNFQILFSVLHAIFLFIDAVGLGIQISNCNTQEGELNICNDYRWCGVYGFNSLYCPKNYCPVGGAAGVFPYNPPVNEDDLHWNDNFKISFSVVIIALILSIIQVFLTSFSRDGDVSAIDDDDANLEGKSVQSKFSSKYRYGDHGDNLYEYF